jgi:hypothetical protein
MRGSGVVTVNLPYGLGDVLKGTAWPFTASRLSLS